MELNWFESIIYAMFSGFIEFLPVSSRAQQDLFLFLFGHEQAAIMDLFIHIAVLFALLTHTQSHISAIRRAGRLTLSGRRRSRSKIDPRIIADRKIFRGACIPVLISIVFMWFTDSLYRRYQFVSLFFLLTGILLYIVGHSSLGAKNSRDMTGFDALLIGLVSALGVLPGISRVGAGLSVSQLRGASAKSSFRWVLLISIPAVVGYCIYDISAIANFGMGAFDFSTLLQCIVCAVIAYFFSSFSISFMRFLGEKIGYSGFAYYSLGLAVFTFILFLI